MPSDPMAGSVRQGRGALCGTRDQVVDDMVELWIIWRERAAAVWVAYEAWAGPPRHTRRPHRRLRCVQ